MDLSEAGGLTGERHPWERHRFAFYRDVIGRAFGAGSTRGASLARAPIEGGSPAGARPLSVLDVGAGDGWFARELAGAWPSATEITLWDSGYGDGEAHDDGFERVREQPEGRFDLVVMIDVAEHVPDDRAFLSNIVQRNVASDGRVLFAVPAWPWLWTTHDERLRHERRYTPRAAKELIASAGLRIVESGGLFPALLPIRAAQMARERVLKTPVPGLDGGPQGPVLRAVDALLSVDRKVATWASRRGLELPGLSWWALCAR